jgi:hypothetical protein
VSTEQHISRYLALALATTLLSSCNSPAKLEPHAMYRKAPLSSWTATSVSVFRVNTAGGKTRVQRVETVAQERRYAITNSGVHSTVAVSAVAIYEPASRLVFVGEKAAFYMIRGSKLTPWSVLPGLLLPRKQIIAEGSEVQNAIASFERDVDMEEIDNYAPPEEELVVLSDFLGRDFFSAEPGSSNSGGVKVKSVTTDGTLILCEMFSPSGAYRGMAGFDPTTHTIKKALFNGASVKKGEVDERWARGELVPDGSHCNGVIAPGGK